MEEDINKALKKMKVLKIILAVDFLILSFVMGILFNIYATNHQGSILSSLSSNTNCTQDKLIDREECMKNQLKEFYYYNITNRGKILTEEQLKSEGGVCSHYAKWYTQQLVNSSFYSKQVVFKVNESVSHEVTIMSSREGYCILDQLNNYCGEFAK